MKMFNQNLPLRDKGYKSLAFFQQATIIHDFTAEFTQKYIDYKSRTRDQMDQAARSGKQNIAEGYLQKSVEGKLKLLSVARGSLEELLNDYLDYLRQHKLAIWNPQDPRSRAVRRLVYNSYKDYMRSPEEAANAMVCLTNQTNLLLDQKLRWLEEQFVKEGGFRENLLKKRLQYRNRHYGGI